MKTKIALLLLTFCFLLPNAMTLQSQEVVNENSPTKQPEYIDGEFTSDRSRSVSLIVYYTDTTLTFHFLKKLGDINTTISTNGVVVYDSLIDVSGPTTELVDITDYAPGVYLFEMTDDGGGYVYGEFIID